ncbi:ArdC family protein [Ruegeria atlantica]|uniref:ArdC family protein n=1 Tax=Ruegeria atlantica TaxID=81569 RepID=UPI0014798536|nr:zincin-like metallopeptidase domain-containing protein [Ruegeria atlantica]
MATKFDIYQHVTDQIIAAIEAGTPPWRQPWTGSAGGLVFPLRSNDEPYRGINVLMLWLAAEVNGYTSAHWFTYRQAQEMGGQVRKGEKSSQVVKYGTFERENDSGDPEQIPYARAYRVFNADQIDDLPERFYIKPEDQRDMGTTAEPGLQAFFEATGARIKTSDQPRAFYSVTEDYIHMPPVGTFHSAEDYFGTLAHEAVHCTGHKSRLDRFKVGMAKQDRAQEELVAEIGSAMVCARLGLVPDFEQNAAYVESWLKALKEDKRAIFKAASAAQKAADFLFETAPEDLKQAA